MNVSMSCRLKQAFVLTKEDLSKLHRALGDFGDRVTYEVACRDRLTRHFNIEELQDYENAPDKEIKSIEIWARASHDVDKSAHLQLSNYEGENIYVRFDGPEEAADKLNSAINERLAGMKPWYSRLATADFFILLGGLLLAFILGILVASAIGLLGPPQGEESKGDRPLNPIAALLALAIVSMPFIGGFVLNRMRDRFFPAGVFAIGQGANRHSITERIRWGVIISFFVSLAASLFVLLLLR